MIDLYVGLKTEIAKPDYNGLDDTAIVAAINAPGASAPQPIPFIWVGGWFAGNGLRSTIEDLSKTEGSPFRSACLGLIDCFWGIGVNRVFDVTDTPTLTLLAGFVTAQLMTEQQHDELINLNAQPGPSIAQTLGFPSITTHDLDGARTR